jgi:hypothetical protein
MYTDLWNGKPYHEDIVVQPGVELQGNQGVRMRVSRENGGCQSKNRHKMQTLSWHIKQNPGKEMKQHL